ncbi:patatin-like phospholipase family protein [Fulvimonas yonginensis]|uniref:Patatin-like phospholipase family protein n=1 Tax=Fulvimonas yonginensis TaxID=1495200 RepID=A0ABU8JBS0_9GAMM
MRRGRLSHHASALHETSEQQATVRGLDPTQLGERIKQAELGFITHNDPVLQSGNEWPWGIALSGGGIRSATFSLGVLQALAENNLLRCFHYLSTVSGGGYAGAFVQGLIQRKGVERARDILASHVDREDLQKPVLHLREYSNYLSPRKALLSGDTLGMVGTYIRNVVLIQIQVLALAEGGHQV